MWSVATPLPKEPTASPTPSCAPNCSDCSVSAAETPAGGRHGPHWLGVGGETADDMMLYVFSRRTFVADTYARRLFAFLGFDAPAGYPAFHKAYAPVVLDTGLDVADLQEFHGLIDEFGKAYRDDAAKNESFLQSWRPGEAAPRPTE